MRLLSIALSIAQWLFYRLDGYAMQASSMRLSPQAIQAGYVFVLTSQFQKAAIEKVVHLV